MKVRPFFSTPRRPSAAAELERRAARISPHTLSRGGARNYPTSIGSGVHTAAVPGLFYEHVDNQKNVDTLWRRPAPRRLDRSTRTGAHIDQLCKEVGSRGTSHAVMLPGGRPGDVKILREMELFKGCETVFATYSKVSFRLNIYGGRLRAQERDARGSRALTMIV